jgi:hypothetical protein
MTWEHEARREHEAKYATLCKKHGLAWTAKSPSIVGETLLSLVEKYSRDEHLNNVPLWRWDALARTFALYQGRTGLALSELVCMQKYAAQVMLDQIFADMRMWCLDCCPDESDQEYIASEAARSELLNFVARKFDGGIPAFLATTNEECVL